MRDCEKGEGFTFSVFLHLGIWLDAFIQFRRDIWFHVIKEQIGLSDCCSRMCTRCVCCVYSRELRHLPAGNIIGNFNRMHQSKKFKL